ncbi:MAG TPA: SDR family oxidoreductase [Xanthobacteraceae bacterium]|nr:SDR family oxidoreductase [Xanthobacteraceae bacterium]
MSVTRTAVVLGATADIGRGLTERLLADGWRVIGVGRTLARLKDMTGLPALELHQCALTEKDSVNALVSDLRANAVAWDLLISSVGTMEPIGLFFGLDFDTWEASINVNFVAQMRALHALWPLRRAKKVVDVMLLAGGGTNNPFRNYSAYCVSKIALIKMCELIDDETADANMFIIGPGYTRTRLLEETLRAGPQAAGDEYHRTLAYLEKRGTPIDEIYQHMRWCMMQGRSIAGGRNFSTAHDPWRDGGETLAAALRDNRDAFRLRRRQP